jgi:hypothetical protein
MEKVKKEKRISLESLDNKLNNIIFIMEKYSKQQDEIMNKLNDKAVIIKSKRVVEVGSGNSKDVESYTHKYKKPTLTNKVNNSLSTISIP